MRIYNKNVCKNTVNKCDTKKDLRTKHPGVYSAIIRNKWYDLIDNLPNAASAYYRTIYAYEFPNNIAYVGLTFNLRQRHIDHKRKGTVYNFCKKNNYDLPEPIILKENILFNEAGFFENKYINKYKNENWSLLNKAKAGSLGGVIIKEINVVVFNENGEKIDIGEIHSISEKYKIEITSIRACLSKRNKSAHCYKFLEYNEWVNNGKPNVIEQLIINNKQEKIALLNDEFEQIKIFSNKRETAVFCGYKNSTNNNIKNLKHNLILNCKIGKVVYYDDYIKYKNGELELLKSPIKKQRCHYLLPYDEEVRKKVIDDLLKVPNWLKNRRKHNHEKILSLNKIDKRKTKNYVWTNSKAVLQYTFDGNFIKEYNKGVSDAERTTKIKGISAASTGRADSAGGFIWIYKNDYSIELLNKKVEKMKINLKNKGLCAIYYKNKETIIEAPAVNLDE